MVTAYESWLDEVRAALQTINMPLDDWQKIWAFDFRKEHAAGTSPGEAADKANRFWWREQNKALNQDCRRMPNCWLPRGHHGDCQPA